MKRIEMIEKLENQIFWIDVSIKRMERVWISGKYDVTLITDVSETLSSLREAKEELTKILDDLQVKNSSKTNNTLTK